MNLPEIDKDELCWALNDSSGMTEYYLDLETGDIISTFGDGLIELGINEEDLESDRYVYIRPILSWEAYDFMVEFIEIVEDDELKRRLYIAIKGRGAFRMFKATLMDYPEEREQWFKFHDKKMEAFADEWLKDLALTLKERTEPANL
jgi:hypothetical protein